MKLALSLLAVAALGVFFWALLGRDVAVIDDEELMPQQRAEEAPTTPMLPERVESSSTRTVTTAVERAPEDGPAPSLAVVRGRFVFPGGTPARGVRVALEGSRASEERVKRFGMPASWVDPAPVVSGPDGRFELRLDPPRAFCFELTATLDEYVAECWRLDEIDPKEGRDLGEVELRQAGGITVRIVDQAGEPVAGEWIVWAAVSPRWSETGSRPMTSSSRHAEADGSYRLDGLSVGPVEVRASSDLVSLRGPVVEVRGGEVIDATITYAGPDLARCIRVRPVCARFFTQDVVETIRLLRGSEVMASHAPSPENPNSVFDDLDPGVYTVEIEDPRFQSWSRSGVEPGTDLLAMLEGNAALALSVVDAATGRAIERYTLSVRLDDSRSTPNVFPVIDRVDEPPEDGVVRGLIPGNQTLLLGASGHASVEVPVASLQPFETRPVTIPLERGVRITGRFTFDDGTTPVRRGSVQLFPTGEPPRFVFPPRFQTSHVEEGRPSFERTAFVDDEGCFELELIPPDRSYALHGHVNPWLVGTIDPLVVGGEDLRNVDLRAPAAARLLGVLIEPEGAGFEGLRLRYEPAASPRIGKDFLFATEKLEATLDETGRFAFDRLPGGAGVLHFDSEPVSVPFGPTGAGRCQGFSVKLAELDLVAGETLERSFDVRDCWPGTLEVTVTRDGAPATSTLVQVFRADGVGNGTGAVTSADGVATVTPLTPGRHEIHVRPLDNSWSFVDPVPVEVGAGELVRRAIPITLVRGTLRVLDLESGEPLAGAAVVIGAERSRFRREHTTDAEGRLELELPVGSIEVATRVMRSEETPTVEWTASGPAPAEVRLKRPR